MPYVLQTLSILAGDNMEYSQSCVSSGNCLVYCFPFGLFSGLRSFILIMCRSVLSQKLVRTLLQFPRSSFYAFPLYLIQCYANSSYLGLSLQFNESTSFGLFLFPTLTWKLDPGSQLEHCCFGFRLKSLLKYFLKVHLECKSKLVIQDPFLIRDFECFEIECLA